MTNDHETPTRFLATLGQGLKTRKGVDAELAGIVEEHILTAVPAANCVEKAMAAINTLAEARISPPKESADG